MSLAIVVITKKRSLNKSFLERLDFADKIYIEKTKGEVTNFSKVRNAVLKRIVEDWIFFVDDDEIISKELAAEIKKAISIKSVSGYYFNRHDLCFYQELKSGEIGRQKILRLARNGSGFFKREVHEIWEVRGVKKTLKNPIYHLKNYFISEFMNRIRFYSPLDTRALEKEQKKYSQVKLILLPMAKFLFNYIVYQGYRDGYPGLFLCYLMSVQSFTVRVYQWEQKTN